MAHSFKAETPFLFGNSFGYVCAVGWSGQLKIYLGRCHLGDQLTLIFTLTHIPPSIPLGCLPPKKLHLSRLPCELTPNLQKFTQITKFDSNCICVTFLETGVLVKALCPNQQIEIFAPVPKKRAFKAPGRLRCADGLWTAKHSGGFIWEDPIWSCLALTYILLLSK